MQQCLRFDLRSMDNSAIYAKREIEIETEEERAAAAAQPDSIPWRPGSQSQRALASIPCERFRPPYGNQVAVTYKGVRI